MEVPSPPPITGVIVEHILVCPSPKSWLHLQRKITFCVFLSTFYLFLRNQSKSIPAGASAPIMSPSPLIQRNASVTSSLLIVPTCSVLPWLDFNLFHFQGIVLFFNSNNKSSQPACRAPGPRTLRGTYQGTQIWVVEDSPPVYRVLPPRSSLIITRHSSILTSHFLRFTHYVLLLPLFVFLFVYRITNASAA
jgi:hypothetical protein